MKMADTSTAAAHDQGGWSAWVAGSPSVRCRSASVPVVSRSIHNLGLQPTTLEKTRLRAAGLSYPTSAAAFLTGIPPAISDWATLIRQRVK